MSLLDLIFPKRCVSCRRFGRYICVKCRSKIEVIEYQICPVCSRKAIDGITHPGCRTRYSLDGLYSFFRYKNVIQKAIKAIKYRLVFDLSAELVSLIPFQDINGLKKQIGNNSILIPIPLHKSRISERGFNQAEILAKEFSKRLEMPVDNMVLTRVKKTTPQTEMKDRKRRLANMQDVFESNKFPEEIGSRKIILFDDVYTTGATLRSAANKLKRKGVKYVFGITIAHG